MVGVFDIFMYGVLVDCNTLLVTKHLYQSYNFQIYKGNTEFKICYG